MRSFAPLALVALLAGCPAPSNDCGGCPDGTVCVAGACQPFTGSPDLQMPDLTPACQFTCKPPTPYCAPGNVCAACVTDAHCPAGQMCQSGSCVPGCHDDARCRANGSSSAACCASRCVDTSSDLANCGGCGMPCAIAHAQSNCAAGKCQIVACNPGWSDCNMNPNDGCETNLHIDPKNCTGCGMTCSIPNAVAACSDGCYMAACQFGYADCNNNPKDGCETSVSADVRNCGACGMSCSNPPHASMVCQNAACLVKSCDPGFADCDGNAANGCETQSGTDANNCGKCGNVCPQGQVCTNGGCTCPQCNNLPNSVSKCVNNQCILVGCAQGFGDCDNNPNNGCEVNLGNDRNNCSACGMACPQGQNCFAGACQSRFQFQASQTIDNNNVICSSTTTNNLYTECDDLRNASQGNLYFANMVQCGPGWSMQPAPSTDFAGFCASLTGNTKFEVYWNCGNTTTRTTWRNHGWGTTSDNGFMQHVRCYY